MGAGGRRRQVARPYCRGMATDRAGSPSPDGAPADAPRASRWNTVQARVGETRDRLIAARRRSQTVDAAFTAVEHDAAVGGGVLAGAMAFRLFLLLVPLIFFLVALFGFGATLLNQSPADLARHTGAGGLIAAEAAREAGQSQADRIATIVIAGVTSVIGAFSALKVACVVHGLVWAEPVAKLVHPWRAVGVFIVVTVVALVLSALIGDLGRSSVPAGVAMELLYLGCAFGIWLLISWHMPRPCRHVLDDARAGRTASRPGCRSHSRRDHLWDRPHSLPEDRDLWCYRDRPDPPAAGPTWWADWWWPPSSSTRASGCAGSGLPTRRSRPSRRTDGSSSAALRPELK